MRYRQIVESTKRITLGGWSRGHQLPVLIDPTERELLAALDRNQKLRGLIDGNDSYWWDGYEATHYQVAQALGVSELSPGFMLFPWEGKLIMQAANHNDQFATFACQSLHRLLASGHILLEIDNRTATLADHLAAYKNQSGKS